MIKVSVIIPIYNSEKYLRQCLDSVINQTLKEIEIICVDDGSTDSSKKILEEYAQKDKRIIVINQKNLYAGVARNNGIKIAKGEYIHFLDSDDCLKSKIAYEYLYKQAKKKKVDMIFFQYQKVDCKTGKIIKRRKKALILDKQISNIKEKPRFFIYYDRQPWCKFYDRNFIIDNQLKFDEIMAANDTAFFFKVILLANKIMVSKKSFINYRVGDEGTLTGTCRFKKYECHFKAYESIKEILENYPAEIRKKVIDSIIIQFFHYYHKSYGEYTKIIYEQLHNFFKITDLSICESNSCEYYWWDEYMAIKNGEEEKAEEYFEKRRIKSKILKFINYLKEKGLKGAIKKVFIVMENKFKR